MRQSEIKKVAADVAARGSDKCMITGKEGVSEVINNDLKDTLF